MPVPASSDNLKLVMADLKNNNKKKNLISITAFFYFFFSKDVTKVGVTHFLNVPDSSLLVCHGWRQQPLQSAQIN